MQVREIMSAFPAYVRSGTDIRRAAELISVSEVGRLMVLDQDDAFLGALSEGDLLRAVLPPFDDVLDAGGSLDDAFRRFVERGAELADRPIDPLVEQDVVTLSPGDEVAAAAVLMLDRAQRRVPVLDGGRLVGTVSRADVCRAVLYHGRAGHDG